MLLHPPIRLAGPGVHSGAPARLELGLRPEPASSAPAVTPGPPGSPRPSGMEGPCFRFPGFPSPLFSADLPRLPRRALRSTVLGGAGAEIRTPEHLLATLLFFADLPLDIGCDSPELPGLDGSALPYREALASLAPERAVAPAWREYPCDLEWEHAWEGGEGREGGHIRVRPADRFRVTYELARPPLTQTFVLEDPVTAWREILPARTFAFHREWREALGSGSGLMAGAGMDSGLLLAEGEAEHGAWLRGHPDWAGGPFPLLNQPEWRVEDELVKHKILDLLGDLALFDLCLPKLRIEVKNGGHAVNHLLLDRLAAYATG